MNPSAMQFILVGLLLSCLSSFCWGMIRFFRRPVGVPRGAKLISACGLCFGAMHVYCILSAPALWFQGALCAASLYICSIAIFWWTVFANLERPLSAAFSPDIPSHLMQDGPYRFVRHPFYACYLLTWAAGALATGQILLLFTFLAMLAIYARAARMEERKFEQSPLATSYRVYRARTGMFFPNPLKLIAAAQQEANA
jgi:protein-S-isoprenylcysteine O-methyltransferase Ste14